MILNQLKLAAKAKAESVIVEDVRIGLGYTAVKMNNGFLGVAATLQDDSDSGCTVFKGKRPVALSPALEVLEYLDSASNLEIGVGIAAANALLNNSNNKAEMQQKSTISQGDLLTAINLTKSDRVGMVGFFSPIIQAVKEQAGELLIFEKNPSRAPGLYPENKIEELLPTCSVVIITATTLVNRTFEKVANAASACRVKALLGPTTPLSPEIFSKWGVTHLSGILAENADAILQIISEAGGTRIFMKHSQKINLAIT